MADWVNHAAVAGARNGTADHTVDATGTGGTVVDGAGFTPTAGRFLLCVVEGAVTSTTPTGWILPTNGSAVSATGLYVFYRVSASGTSADQIATTHNGSNFPAMFDFYEFPASSSFVASVSATGVGNGGAGPNLTGLTGTNWIAGAIGSATSGGISTTTWSAGTEEVDVSIATAATDGYTYSLAYSDDDVSSSAQWAATLALEFVAAERLMFAVNVATPAVAPGIVIAFTKVL